MPTIAAIWTARISMLCLVLEDFHSSMSNFLLVFLFIISDVSDSS